VPERAVGNEANRAVRRLPNLQSGNIMLAEIFGAAVIPTAISDNLIDHL
jgi:hypothetical protein